MTPVRPYLLRAYYEWILDNNQTPYILVNATLDCVDVPRQHVKDGRIVFNIAPQAVQAFIMNNQEVTFEARFSGVLKTIYIPMKAVLAIYAQETGEGKAFEESEGDDEPPTEPSPQKTEAKTKRPVATGKPNLKVVK